IVPSLSLLFLVLSHLLCSFFSFFFHHTPTTELYTLSLHDALPIYLGCVVLESRRRQVRGAAARVGRQDPAPGHDPAPAGDQLQRSEEHTSELQSLAYLVCRLLLEKKKKKFKININML